LYKISQELFPVLGSVSIVTGCKMQEALVLRFSIGEIAVMKIKIATAKE
jgi:hypothetical protein